MQDSCQQRSGVEPDSGPDFLSTPGFLRPPRSTQSLEEVRETNASRDQAAIGLRTEVCRGQDLHGKRPPFGGGSYNDTVFPETTKPVSHSQVQGSHFMIPGRAQVDWVLARLLTTFTCTRSQGGFRCCRGGKPEYLTSHLLVRQGATNAGWQGQAVDCLGLQ